jgi:hypothetical protein
MNYNEPHEDYHLESQYEDRTHIEDDFSDYNQNEADDYVNEDYGDPIEHEFDCLGD